MLAVLSHMNQGTRVGDVVEALLQYLPCCLVKSNFLQSFRSSQNCPLRCWNPYLEIQIIKSRQNFRPHLLLNRSSMLLALVAAVFTLSQLSRSSGHIEYIMLRNLTRTTGKNFACVCVCVCVCARACVCVCACV